MVGGGYGPDLRGTTAAPELLDPVMSRSRVATGCCRARPTLTPMSRLERRQRDAYEEPATGPDPRDRCAMCGRDLWSYGLPPARDRNRWICDDCDQAYNFDALERSGESARRARPNTIRLRTTLTTRDS